MYPQKEMNRYIIFLSCLTTAFIPAAEFHLFSRRNRLSIWQKLLFYHYSFIFDPVYDAYYGGFVW